MVGCKACGDGELKPFLHLGSLPLGNVFLKKEDFQMEERFQLSIGFCESCTLVQQMYPPPISSLIKDYRNYRYVPVGKILEDHYEDLAQRIVKEYTTNDSFIIDIGSNNGLLLRSIKKYNSTCRILGVEPAIEISERARQNGVPTITEFFSADLARQIADSHGYADVITVTQVLQHIPHLKDFLEGVHHLLRAQGVFIVEGRYIADIIKKYAYDAFYHEMLYFFSLQSLIKLLKPFNLIPVKAELTSVYGGSLRVYVKRTDHARVDSSIFEILSYETELGLNRYETYSKWAFDVEARAAALRSLVFKLKEEGKIIVGYGAPSTSCTLLNYCGIGEKHLSYIVDDSPLKQGLYTPGSHIKIVSPKMLEANRPDYILLLAWRLKDEILPKLKALRDKGTKVIIPLPELKVI